MADVWTGLCAKPYRKQVEEALRTVDEGARLHYVSTAQELRSQVQEAMRPLGVVIGPLEGQMSPVNVAAALTRDGMAASVILMASALTDDFRRRALKAGVGEIVDLSAVGNNGALDLDEPQLCDDEVPTMLWAVPSSPQVNARKLPSVEQGRSLRANPQFDDNPDVQTKLIAMPTRSPLMTMDLVEEPAAIHDVSAHRPTQNNELCGQAHAPIIAFVSGRGGVGKTALVAAMATAAHRWGMKVALCDLDLWFGNLYSCFGLPGPADMGSLTQQDLQGEGLLSCGESITSGMTLWGPCAVPEYAEAAYPLVGELLSQLSQRYDAVFVDTSVSFTDAVAQAVQQCDRLVLTVDNREGSEAAQSRLAALAVRLGVARTRIVRLANRCGPRGRGVPEINRADIGLETARTLRVLDGGGEVSDCLGEGKVDDLFEVGSRFAETAAGALAQLLSELGCLPNHQDARAALESRRERTRWGFGRKREAM